MILMNSCMMPQEGTYYCERIMKKTFIDFMIKYKKEIKSYIGYPQTVNIIEKLSGVKVKLSREQTFLQDHETYLVIKLKYRIQNFQKKNQKTHGQKIEDYEFFLIEYFNKTFQFKLELKNGK